MTLIFHLPLMYLRKENKVRLKILLIIAIFSSMVSLNIFANAVTSDISRIIHKNGTAEILSPVNNINNEKFSDFDTVNQSYALVVFYRSSCPHCQHFIPVLAQFGSDAGFKIYAYSTDGQSLPALQDTMPMTPSIEKTFFDSPNIEVPSLFIINTKTMQTYLIDRGEMDYTGLMNRVKMFFDMLQGDHNHEAM